MDNRNKQILENCLFFSHVTSEQLEVVMEKMEQVQLAHENTLFREGNAGDYVCFILDGALEVIKSSKGGAGNVIATLVAGSSIGEMALIDGQPRSASVRSLGSSQLAVLTKSTFDQLVEEEPLISVNILKGLAAVLSDNLRETSQLLNSEMR